MCVFLNVLSFMCLYVSGKLFNKITLSLYCYSQDLTLAMISRCL